MQWPGTAAGHRPSAPAKLVAGAAAVAGPRTRTPRAGQPAVVWGPGRPA